MKITNPVLFFVSFFWLGQTISVVLGLTEPTQFNLTLTSFVLAITILAASVEKY